MKPLEYLKKLNDAGYEAYIVGGYVRDTLLGINTNDVDIATNATPEEITKMFGISLKDELGSVNIKSGDMNIDITTYRKEYEYIGHKPSSVEYIDDLMEDLKRRDFTINAICMNSEGITFDPLNGIDDLNARIIKCIGNANVRFTEDPLRMLRALRLSIIYDLEIDDDALQFILNNKDFFNQISYERKRNELDKILVSDNCIKGLKFLKDLDILNYLGIDYDNINSTHDLLGMWAQLEYDGKYPFTKHERVRIDNIKNIIQIGKIDEHILFRYGLYDSLVAAKILGIPKSEINDKYNNMQIHDISELKINGNDIIDALLLKDYKLIKVIKKDLLENIISGNLTNEKLDLINYIIKKWK